VLPASRRIFLYWLLLLVPALVVGGVAVWLWQREEARLRAQSAEVAAARQATLAAQTRLIVENVELFTGDVQTGLLDVLAAEPVAGLDLFLDRWERSNPLVRMTFRCQPDGKLLRPTNRPAGEEAQGFVRRFAREFAIRPPWGSRQRAATAQAIEREEKRQQATSAERKIAAQNVFQAQSARRDLQQLASNREYALADRAPAPAAAAAPTLAAETKQGRAEAKLETAADSALPVGDVNASTKALAKDAATLARGWQSLVFEGRLHLIGWVQPEAGGEVRGLELQLAGLVSRLGGALPSEVGEGEGFALRDDQGRILHQRGAVPAGATPAVRVPLAAGFLPGWDVVAFRAATSSRGGGAGVFWVGAVLVGIFVAAIVAGGSLLLWQAQRSEAEAVQKTSFVANVSHEFKTPLTTIRLYAELLEQGRVRDAAQGGEYLRTIGRETQRLARLVNNALDFSRLEQGRKQFARATVDLGENLGRLLDTHAPRVAEAGLALRRELPPGPLVVCTDGEAVGQIVLNLIDNACKYAAAGGEVTVSAAAHAAGGAVVRVGDRGAGVPVAHRERIFEKFHRVDDALTAEKTGAGLGLSIARQLARGLGGELRYLPREGGGAEFVLELP
jgi:two-component system phosphate regulon sensor histidine kinase PhoR